MIFKYRDDYVYFNVKELEDIKVSYLIYFLSFNLISSTIKYNYWPSQWFSKDPILGHDRIKCIMWESKFLRIISYLHICDTNNQLSREHTEYYPSFKVREFHQNMENHFLICFVPGIFLSLDEYLVHAFIKMKVKFIIITK